ncbi:MAG: 6-phosphogluconolactonase, partial [Candidatus Margulisiibacteriota bacterium]
MAFAAVESRMKVLPKTGLVYEIMADRLRVGVYQDATLMGRAGAQMAASEMRRLEAIGIDPSMNFAAAPSQRTFWASLVEEQGLPWDRTTATHMDDFMVSHDHILSFAGMLRDELFSKLPSLKNIYYVNGSAADPASEADRYGSVLDANPRHIQVVGIGDNAHIAFAEPYIPGVTDPDERIYKANAWDRSACKIVKIDDQCKAQQRAAYPGVEIPDFALSMTVPAILSAGELICLVPYEQKAHAVLKTFTSLISEEVPATALRTHDNAFMLLDLESASLVIDIIKAVSPAYREPSEGMGGSDAWEIDNPSLLGNAEL